MTKVVLVLKILCPKLRFAYAFLCI
ncbi:hypothetical protein TorRG33x02_155500 [Trema orientale]|uniref:Uncharacterized protein n=1 Tax=Trema orientale TaxID=63057 RepID=A0A2P5ET10_TREOI|nr:hypothetical protein TorRG33x02_155500 [Trema orientale]